ncbi:MAG TPA: WXG100 family type VII secretion target [Mycobacterium sp.]|nr:WXG100 family type VII secretion target [Mycobacterium sp.]
MTLRVNLEDLICAAAQAGGHCEDLASGHLLSGNRIENAKAGWVGSSAAAIGARLTAWQEESTALLTRLGDHVQGLRDAAIIFAATEDVRGRALGHLVGAPRC